MLDYDAHKEAEIDRLADTLKAHVDVDVVRLRILSWRLVEESVIVPVFQHP